MKILVTGATGAVSGQVARQLSGSGHQAVALVRDPSKADLLADVTLAEGDLTDPSASRGRGEIDGHVRLDHRGPRSRSHRSEWGLRWLRRAVGPTVGKRG